MNEFLQDHMPITVGVQPGDVGAETVVVKAVWGFVMID